ncbi:hypothetical protein [Devosia marina]|uniref:Uncharacterized protein n=1 Tax=Devosia marina TaxID=2683198 RepID=A0A7X3K285_9HYPH|nr:hypothetical protein [Devosia marina]MVS97896.1 hypothetical protein [Devosia marina]
MTHWRATSRNPHEKSTAAFLMAGHERLAHQEGPALPLWIPPQDLESVEPSAKRYWALQNPALRQAENVRRATATAMVDKIVRPELAGSYDHPHVEAVINHLMQLQRVALKSFYDVIDEMPSPPGIQPANAIIYFTKSALRAQHAGKTENALDELTAKLLSRGIPVGEANNYGVNRNHVRRAEKAFLNSLLRIVNRFDEAHQNAVLKAHFGYWRERVAVLLEIEAKASVVQRFRGLSGKALVDAIDRHPGMLTTYLRHTGAEAA